MVSDGDALSNRSSSPVTERPAADMEEDTSGAGDERLEEGVSFRIPRQKRASTSV